MKRYSASSTTAQKWLKESSLDYIKISSIYDKLGHFRLSEDLYNKSVKLSSFIRVSEDEEIREDLVVNDEENEEDVDVLVVPDVNLDEYQVGHTYKFYQEGVDESGSIAIHDFDYNDNLNVNDYVKALSLGGQNVFNSLKELANYFQSLTFENRSRYFEQDQTEKFIRALAWYYKNPIFLESEFNAESKLLANHIFNNRIDQDSVAIVSRSINMLNERKKLYLSVEDKIKKLISELRPELLGDINVIKYFTNFSIKVDERILPDRIKDFDIFAFEKSLSITNTMADVRHIYIFLKNYSSEIIYEKTKAVLSDKKDFYNVKDNTELMTLVFGRNFSYISQWMLKLYPGLMDALALNVNNTKNNEIRIKDLNVAIMTFGYEYVAHSWNSGEELNAAEITKQYYDEFPDHKLSIQTKILKYLAHWRTFLRDREGDPNDILVSSGYEFSNEELLYFELFDKANPEFGIEVAFDIYDRELLYVVSEFPQSCIPDFIRYYEKYPKDNFHFHDKSNFQSFIKLHTKIGDKILEYRPEDMILLADGIYFNFDISGSVSDSFSQTETNLSCEQFDIIKSHSGHDDLFDVFKTEYFACPFIYDIPFDKIFNLVKFINHNPPKRWGNKNYPANLDIDMNYVEYKEKTLGYDDFQFAIKNLYLLGEYDPSLADKIIKIQTSTVWEGTRDYYKTILTDNNFGDFERLVSISTYGSQNKDLNPSEIEAVEGPLNVTRSQILRVREIINNPRNRNYSNVEPFSDTYKKIFHMIAKNEVIGGKSVELLTSLFDSAIYKDQIDTIYRGAKFNFLTHLFKISVALGITDFSKANYENFEVIHELVGICNVTINSYKDPLEKVLGELELKPAQLINIGGWKSLRSKDENEVDEFLAKINHRNPENFKSILFSDYINTLDSVLENAEIFYRIDMNIFTNKFIIKSLKDFNSQVSLVDVIFNEDKIEYPESSSLKKKFRDFMLFESELNYYMSKNESDEFKNQITSIYRNKISYPDNVINPSYFTDYNRNTINTENVSNAGKIITFFGNNSKAVLDTFSFKYCRAHGYPTKGFYSVPSHKLRADIIHDLANLLPDDYKGQSFSGYTGYFIKYYPEDQSNHLKLVGNSWNNTIKIWDENQKQPLEIGKVSEFSHRFTPNELYDLINIDALQSVLKGELNSRSDEFAIKFVTKVGMPSSENNKSLNYKMLYSGAEEVYLMGQEVSLPDWANYTDSYNGMTLRFLQRNDPSGMFLGLDTKCCQHPRDYAASCAYDGFVNPNAAFVVFENINGELLFQSYVWADENDNVCFDSIEGATRDIRNDSNLLESVGILLKNFAKSLPSGKICTTGSSYFGRMAPTPLKNPTTSNKIPIISDLLTSFSPYKDDRLYISDSQTQFIIGSGES